jgi:excisionase family DNA binding protein
MKFSKLTKPELEAIIENANFTDEEYEIFIFLSSGKSLEEISQTLSTSKATLSRRVKDIKIKIERNDNMVKTIPIWEKIMLTVEEASEYSNIGINKIQSMLNEPGCTFVFFVGKGKRLVKRKEFEKYIEKTREI